VYKDAKLVTQKKRKQGEEKREAAKKEVAKLMATNFIKWRSLGFLRARLTCPRRHPVVAKTSPLIGPTWSACFRPSLPRTTYLVVVDMNG